MSLTLWPNFALIWRQLQLELTLFLGISRSAKSPLPVRLSSANFSQPEISHLKAATRTFAVFRPGVFGASVNATEPTLGAASSSIPARHHSITLDEVRQFVGDAKDCHDMEQEEAGWNNLVHTPLLRAVFYGTKPRGRQLDGFCPWSVDSKFIGRAIMNG